ncbi:hypothetical protein MKW92_010349, partial [Papaver armeniacum]
SVRRVTKLVIGKLFQTALEHVVPRMYIPLSMWELSLFMEDIMNKISLFKNN